MNDEHLIEHVRQHSVLYDLFHPKYMDRDMKQNIWNKIGKALKNDAATCKCRWNNIRDNYRKSLKKNKAKTGEKAKRAKLYKYAEQLSFLSIYFDDKETKDKIETQDEEEYQESEDREGDDENEMITEDSQGTSEKSNLPDLRDDFQVPPKSTKRNPEINRAVPPEQPVSAKLMEYIISKNEPAATTSQPHPVDAFLAGLAPTLKTFSPYYLNLAKSEIFAAVQKYELKLLKKQDPNLEGADENMSP